METDERDRLTRVADSAVRLHRLAAQVDVLQDGGRVVLRNELEILWRRSFGMWVRMRWPRLARWLARR